VCTRAGAMDIDVEGEHYNSVYADSYAVSEQVNPKN